MFRTGEKEGFVLKDGGRTVGAWLSGGQQPFQEWTGGERTTVLPLLLPRLGLRSPLYSGRSVDM